MCSCFTRYFPRRCRSNCDWSSERAEVTVISPWFSWKHLTLPQTFCGKLFKPKSTILLKSCAHHVIRFFLYFSGRRKKKDINSSLSLVLMGNKFKGRLNWMCHFFSPCKSITISSFFLVSLKPHVSKDSKRAIFSVGCREHSFTNA